MRIVLILLVMLAIGPATAARFLCIQPDGSSHIATDPTNCSTIIGLPEQSDSVSRESQTASPALDAAPGAPQGQPDTQETLPFEIFETEQQKKGGTVRPLRPPQYVLLVVRAALDADSSELTNQNVKNTARRIVHVVRADSAEKGVRFDAISLLLYQSLEHGQRRQLPVAQADWWPKGHSLSYDNDENIKNKKTYVESVKIVRLPKEASEIAGRLSDHTRKAIWADAFLAGARAEQEASLKFPISQEGMSRQQVKTYNWKTAMKNWAKENERLRLKYKEEVLRKYDITEAQLQQVVTEAIIEAWPEPPK
jgi:hypothetical protein